MEFEQILKLIDHVADAKLASFDYKKDGERISITCKKDRKVIVNTAVPAAGTGLSPVAEMPVESSASAALKEEKQLEGNLVKSPLVGTFYAAPSEDAAPFVKVGDKVEKGQILAIVEAMKLMNEIESDFDGEIAEIYVKNGQPVEYGQPLFRIA